jgi:pimeloyl-ACP methyl ester carboxylesterase
MRRALWLLPLVLIWHLRLEAQEGPPPPQSFGPDTYRTGVFTGQGTSRPGLDCVGSTAHGRVCSGFLASEVDGTLIDVTVAVPPGAGPHPLIAVLHGWGGSKDSLGYLSEPLLADGHAALRYSARGFGRSWGQVNLADANVEVTDLRSMIGQVVDEARLHLDAQAVGVTGVSYGGGQTWLALLQPSFKSRRGDVRIRAVAPIVPWSDLVYALLPNGRPERSIAPAGSPKLSYINGLYASGLRTSAERPYPNYPDYLVAWHAWLNAMEPNAFEPVYRQLLDGTAGYRSIWWRQDFWRDAAVNRVPVFQIQGLTDDLFPLPEAKRMLLALKAIDPLYPIASYFGDIGHPRAGNKPAERDYVVGLLRQWFAYYLRGIGTPPQHVIRAAITRPRTQPFDPRDVVTVESYDTLASGTVSKQFNGAAILTNPSADPHSGFFWDPLVMEGSRELQPLPAPPDAALAEGSLGVFTVDVAELSAGQPLLVAGQPSVSLLASTTAPRVQLNVRLVDVAPDGARELVTRGTFVLEGPAVNASVTIPTYGNLWEARAEHRLRLEISNLDSPYLAPSRVPSATQISQVRLDLPTRQRDPSSATSGGVLLPPF